jgi:hypothetical protein
MSNEEHDRKRYDAPMKGYKRHTIFINIALLNEAKKLCANERITVTKLIEEALRNRINFHEK